MKTIIIEGIESNLPAIRNFVTKFTKELKLKKDIIETLVICTDEVCANIIAHNYKNKPGKMIKLRIEYSPQAIIIDIYDEGFKFNPLKHTTKKNRNLKEIKAQGMGLFILCKLMDEIQYEYIKGKGNHLRIIKKVSSKDFQI